MRQHSPAQRHRKRDRLCHLWLENLPLAAAMLDRNLKYLLTSQRWLSDLGLQQQDIIGRSLPALRSAQSHAEVFPQSSQPLQAACQRCLAEAIELLVEESFQQTDGSMGWRKWEIRPWREETGEIGGVILTTEDITQRKQAEATLKQTKTELEGLVQERTREFQKAVARLQEEIREREQAETQLRKERDFNQKLIQNSPAFFIAIKADGTVMMMNDAVLRALEYTADEVVGKNYLSNFVPARDRPLLVVGFKQLAATGQTNVTENHVLTKSGEQLLVEWRVTPVFQEDGSLDYFFGVGIDITERKLAEAALAESETKFRYLVENATDLIWSCTIDGILTYISPHFKQMAGYEPSEFLGQSYAPLVHPDDLPSGLAFLNQVAATGEKKSGFEFRCIRKDSSWFWAVCNVSPVKNPDGKVVGFQGIIRDISDRKQAELALQESQQFIQTIADNSPNILYIFDIIEQRNIYINRDIAVTLGYTAQQIQAMGSKLFATLIHPDDLPGVMRHQDAIKAAADGEVIEVEYRMRHANGQWRWLYSRETVFKRDENGDVVQYIGTAQDISERKQAEEALRLSAQQLQEQAQREQLINQLTSQIRNSLDFNVIVETTLHEVQKVLQSDRCHLAWYHGNVEEPYWDISAEVRHAHLPDLTGRYPASAFGLLATKLLKLENLQIADAELVEDLTWQASVRSLGMRAVLIVPVQFPSGAIVVISCSHSTQPRLWSDSEVELLQAVMEQLAIALNQADLYAQTRTKAQELEQTLRELQQTQAQLVQTEKMSSLGQLVAGVAHEINNPVNFIYGNLAHANGYMQDLLRLLELYQTHYPNPHPEIQDEAEAVDLDFLIQDLPKLLSSMKVGAERIQKIVLALRNFSRMDEAEVKAIDIHEGIDSTLMILHNRLKDKPDHRGIEVIKDYSDLPLVECYVGQLNQVFMNLLANAIDALDERDSKRSPQEVKENPSCITIRTQLLNPQQVQIRIADNGFGMTETVRKRLFEPFFTTKPIGKGTGLGLSISYQVVVEKHGGQLECLSSPGKGAEFLITLPLVARYDKRSHH